MTGATAHAAQVFREYLDGRRTATEVERAAEAVPVAELRAYVQATIEAIKEREERERGGA